MLPIQRVKFVGIFVDLTIVYSCFFVANMSICLVQKVHKFPFVSLEFGHPASYQKTLPLKDTTPPSSYARPWQSQHISMR